MLLALLSAAANVTAQTTTTTTAADSTDTHSTAKTETRDRSTVPISFLPPPLETATYSLGIYEARSGKLVRTLHQSAAESAFTVGLNGFITQWDRKDDAGKTVPPGKYAARGYAVGALKVEGVAIHGNDWVSEDESLRIQKIKSIALVPEDAGLAAVAEMAGDHLVLLRFSGHNGSSIWKHDLAPTPDTGSGASGPTKRRFGGMAVNNSLIRIRFRPYEYYYRVSDGTEDAAKRYVPSPDYKPHSDSLDVLPDRWPVSTGKDNTLWGIDEGGLTQLALEPTKSMSLEEITKLTDKDLQKFALRHLESKAGEPAPKIVSASTVQDRLYLLEEMPGWQRVRGLSWVETKYEEGGKKVSTWETFFERNIRTPDAALGLEDSATAKAPSPVVELSLVKNELSSSGKPAKAKLTADFDAKGSYLETTDGLRLRQISERPNLRAVKLAKGKTAGSLSFFQTDGAAWDEFSVEGADKLMSFDAGEFELSATGEKPVESKAPEPDL